MVTKKPKNLQSIWATFVRNFFLIDLSKIAQIWAQSSKDFSINFRLHFYSTILIGWKFWASNQIALRLGVA